MITNIIKYASIFVGGFLFIYNIAHFEIRHHSISRYRDGPHTYYFYHQEGYAIGAACGFALLLTGIAIKLKSGEE
jgi:hypothetical protein